MFTKFTKQTRLAVMAMAIAMFMLVGQSAHGVVAVDFDNAGGGPTQLGYAGLTTAGGTIASASGVSGTVTLSLSSDGAVDSRDRGAMNAAQPLADLGRDFVFGNRGQGANFLDVTIEDLAPGSYTFTTFHHDNNGSSAFDIDVDVNTGGGFADASTVSRSFGTNPAAGVASESFNVDATGGDVTLRLVASTNGHLINGLTIVPTEVQALSVDIGANGHDIQQGFVSFERGTAAGADDESESFFTPFGVNDVVTATLTNANVFRDRRTSGNPVAGPLGDLAESFFAHQDELILTLSDLEAGNYEITTFHHDSQTDHGGFRIELLDANGLVSDLGLEVDASFGTNPSEIGTAMFKFAADGANDVIIRFFEGPNSPNSIVLNGFTLNTVPPVPEPTTAVLSLLGVAGLVRRRRRAA